MDLSKCNKNTPKRNCQYSEGFCCLALFVYKISVTVYIKSLLDSKYLFFWGFCFVHLALLKLFPIRSRQFSQLSFHLWNFIRLWIPTCITNVFGAGIFFFLTKNSNAIWAFSFSFLILSFTF